MTDTQGHASMAGVLMLARAQLRRSIRATLVLGVLAGIVGGVVLTSAQLARRTATAYERLERVSGVPDAIVLANAGVEQASRIATLPEVETAWITATGIAQLGGDAVHFVGVVAGFEPPPPGLFTPVILEGRRPDPGAANELMISERFAEIGGAGVGDQFELSFLTAEEFTQFDTGFGEPDGPKIRMRIVGVARTIADEGINALETFATPALARELGAAATSFPTVFVRLRDEVPIARFERAVEEINADFATVEGGEEFGIEVQVPSRQRPVVAVTSRVLVIGLVSFAAVAGLAGLLAIGLALRRHFLAAADPDAPALISIGATTGALRLARFLAALPFVAIGALTACALAVGFAFVEPIGSMSQREPNPGWHPNVAIVATGGVVLTVVLAAVALLAAGVRRPRADHAPGSPSRLVRRISAQGAPTPVVIGTRLALEPGRGRTAIPVRSAILGTAFGVVGLIGVLVYSASLDHVIETPARWGWVADARVFDATDEAITDLTADPRFAAVARVDEVQVDVEGRNTPAEAFTAVKGAVGWTMQAGRLPTRPGEVVVGARLGRELGRGVGDTLTFRDAEGDAVRLRVVGIGVGPNLNNQQFGSGVVIAPQDIERVRLTQPFVDADVRYAPGVDGDAVTRELAARFDLGVPARPPDVDNVAQLDALPQLLIAFLAVLGVAVLAHLLVMTARRRRRELDTLRAIGFVPNQVRGVITTASLVTVAVGLVIGIPLGVMVGRVAWRLTAHAIYVTGDTRIPLPAIAAFVVAALAVGVLASAWPAWTAGHGPVTRSLRDE